MKTAAQKKHDLLGMNFSTASHQLRKSILFRLVIETGKNTCFHCGASIDTVEELSIEHKKPWMSSDDPIKLFFDIDNIGFSHLICNSKAAVRTHKKYATKEERLIAERPRRAARMRRVYSTEARRDKKRRTGY